MSKKPAISIDAVYWASWIEGFSWAKMWSVWALLHSSCWQGPIHPHHVSVLVNLMAKRLLS